MASVCNSNVTSGKFVAAGISISENYAQK